LKVSEAQLILLLESLQIIEFQNNELRISLEKALKDINKLKKQINELREQIHGIWIEGAIAGGVIGLIIGSLITFLIISNSK
jgi:hypothetical protein